MVKKIFAKNVAGINFKNVGIVKIGGQEMKDLELKKYLTKKVQGGKTLTALEKELKQEGLVDSQLNKRKELMRVLGGGDTNNNKEEKKVPWYRRSLASQDENLSQTTGVSFRNVRGGTGSVSVDTSATGGKMRSRINPLSSAAGPAINGASRPSAAPPRITLAR